MTDNVQDIKRACESSSAMSAATQWMSDFGVVLSEKAYLGLIAALEKAQADGLKEIANNVSPGLGCVLMDVVNERKLQIARDGHTAEHDDALQGGELAEQASVYLLNGQHSHRTSWAWKHKHPSSKHRVGRRAQLLIGVALGVAEIERRDRAQARKRK